MGRRARELFPRQGKQKNALGGRCWKVFQRQQLNRDWSVLGAAASSLGKAAGHKGGQHGHKGGQYGAVGATLGYAGAASGYAGAASGYAGLETSHPKPANREVAPEKGCLKKCGKSFHELLLCAVVMHQ